MAAFYVFLRVLFLFKISFINFSSCESVDVKLVFELQNVFQSDLILVAKDDDTHDVLIKTFYKYENSKRRGFMGVINIKEDFAKMEKNLFSSFQNVIVILDAKTNSIEALVQVQNLHLMSSFIWIYFFHDGLVEKLNDLYIPFNSRFYIIKKIEDSFYEIEDVYQISEDSEKIYTRFGLWKNGQLEVFLNDSYGRRMDLKGHRFNVVESNVKENKDKYEYLWKLFSKKMNFSVVWRSEALGFLFPNGTKTGLFKLIAERKLDGGSSTFFYTKERLNNYDYIFPTMILTTKFYVKIESKFDWASFVAPFSLHIYLSIFLWIIVSSFIIYLIIRFNGYKKMDSSLFIVIQALFYQSGTLNSARISLYISFLMPYLLALMLTQYYSGALSSFLTVKQKNLPFRNLNEIIDDGSYKILVLKNSYHDFYFKTDKGTHATAIRRKNLLVEVDKLSEDLGFNFRQLCEHRWVFLYLQTHVTGKPKCEIAQVDETFMVDYVGIMVWKDFPYKNVMTKVMKRLQFSGLVEFTPKRTNKIPNDLEELKPFSMELVFPIFLLYLSFAILSMLMLLCELFWGKYNERL